MQLTSQDLAAEPSAPTPPARADYAEQALFTRSPFNLWITTALLYLALVGAYGVAAFLSHLPWIVQTPAGAVLEPRARLALVLSLIVCTVLGMQRYSRLKDLREAPAIARVLDPGVSWMMTEGSAKRPWLVTGVGLVLGAGMPWLFVSNNRGPGLGQALAVTLWFTVVAMLLSALFCRGVVFTRLGVRHAANVIRNHLTIDLLRIDLLYPWGRSAARSSLIWFTVSAATCLIFVSDGVSIYTAALLVVCAGFGVWTFVGGLGSIHTAIRAAKTAELDRVCAQIAALKPVLDSDPAAPARFQALLAYEARIATAPEWPFDQTILVRLGASALILTVPWFGQAIAGLVVERFGHLLR